MSFADPKTIWPVLSELLSKELLELQQQKDTGSHHTELPGRLPGALSLDRDKFVEIWERRHLHSCF